MLKLFRETWKRVREELKAEIKLKKEIKELDFLEFELTKEPYLSPKFSDNFYGTTVF